MNNVLSINIYYKSNCCNFVILKHCTFTDKFYIINLLTSVYLTPLDSTYLKCTMVETYMFKGKKLISLHKLRKLCDHFSGLESFITPLQLFIVSLEKSKYLNQNQDKKVKIYSLYIFVHDVKFF